MKKVYICANYSGLEENYFKFLSYCKYVAGKGCIPLNVVTMYHNALDENIPQEREIIISASKLLVEICDEVWVFGKCRETLIADLVESGKPIIYVKDNFRANNTSELLSVILREYESKTGRMTNRAIMENILFYLNKGISRELIIAAIEKTAKVGSGWNYTEGILRNCLSRGITTLEGFKRQGAPQKKETADTYDLDLFEQMLNSRD